MQTVRSIPLIPERPGLGQGFRNAEEAVTCFWQNHARGEPPLRSSIACLTQLALARDEDLAAQGTRRLFRRIVEPLCDAFTARDCEIYRRTFAQVIHGARISPDCRGLDGALRARGIRAEQDLLRTPREARLPQPELVIVLSRHTLGADVAVNGPVLWRMQRRFPDARICFLGGEGARVLARCFPGVEHCPVPYGRTATLAERLNAWPALCAVIADLVGFSPDRCIVVDPDSRLTQLGLLPPVPGACYRHFPSRSYAAEEDSPLSLLVERWLDEVFGRGGRGGTLRLAPQDERWAAALRASLACDPRPLVSISFGTGGNDAKSAGFEFEARLLQRILRRGWRVLLARGTDPGEVLRALALGDALAQQGLDVTHLPRGRVLPPPGLQTDLVTWEADVGAFFAAISSADLYLGYDSSGQHIAAALGVPTLAVFVESAGPRHALRWSPRGLGPVRVVRAVPPVDVDGLFHRVCDAFAALAALAGSPRRRHSTEEWQLPRGVRRAG